MRRIACGVLFVLFAFLSHAHAQSAPVILPGGCGTASYYSSLGYMTVDTSGKLCVNATVTASATFSLTAASTLPTLTAGPGAAGYESLSGAQYVQPVFGSTVVSNTNGLPVNCVTGCAGGGGGGGGAVFGPTAVGSAAANPPVLMGGTANATATGNVQVAKVDASGTQYIDAVSGGALLNAINSGSATLGASLPSAAVLWGINTNNLLAAPHLCGSSTFVHITTATDTQLIALSSGKNIYVCDYEFSFSGAGTFYLESATAASCGGTKTQIAQAWTGAAQFGKSAAEPYYRGINSGSSNALCANTSTFTGPLDLTVYYDQY